MEKRVRSSFSFLFLRTCSSRLYPLILWITFCSVSIRNARRSLTAGAQRPSERGGVISSARAEYCVRS